ncbi:MAG: DUF2339 domain-containing protein [Terracidiphilus sp.]|nr:DUF2339 domain-containing protein [Terracidiphilus sp.]MDR3797178.1 DUF2339 domain-containing protein [Terracidiphilus sp.]
MDSIVFLIVLVVGAIIALPIVAIVTATSRTNRVRGEMTDLMSRIRSLETRLEGLARQSAAPSEPPREATQAIPAAPATAGFSPPATKVEESGPAAAPPAERVVVAPEPAAHPAASPFEPTMAAEPPPFFSFGQIEEGSSLSLDSPSLESRIGSQWFNRIGILAVLIGVAWFLKLAFDNHWIGPTGRIFSGLLAGVALIVWSERFQKRGFAAFSYSLKAVGSGTLYLSLWAAYQVYALVPAGVAFGAMIAVTAFNGLMAWVQDSELLALYAVAGGLVTPALVSTGGNHEITLFSYLLVLDVAVLVLVALRPWSRLLFVASAGTAVFVLAWWFVFYAQWEAARTAIFLGCFFLISSLAPRLVHAPLDEIGGMRGWDALALVMLPVGNAALSFLGFYCLLPAAVVNWAGPWLAVAFAAYYLFLMRLPERGVLRAGPVLLPPLHLAMAIVFLTIAIPLKTQGRWMTVGWLVEGAVLLWAAVRVRSSLVRAFALICLVLGLGALLAVNPPTATRPFLNERFGTYCVAIAIFAFVAWLAKHTSDEEDPTAVIPWRNLAAAGVLAVNALALIAISLEIHSFWWFLCWRGETQLLGDYEMYAQFTYSAFFMLYGAALLTAGFLRRSAFLRWQALVLLAATIAKVFLIDISQLSQGFRILSFIGLGVLLLAVSFVYQRDWLNLRGRKEENS